MSEFKTIILSGSLLQWYVPNPDQHVVVYRHSIKYPYVPEGFEPLRSAFEVFMWPYHQYPNKYLSNSDRTKRHLKNRLNINSEVVYPPIVTKDYQHIADGDFFLTVTRVTKGKCVDHLVESFRSIDERLVIAGDGDLRSKLEERSPDNVELLGYVSEEKKRELLGRCRCFINHSGAELFGIAAAEALASGKPILMAKGGYNHVQDGMNGFTYQHENLGPAIRKFQSDGVEWDRRRIKEFAEERYGIERFKNQIKSAVDPK